MEKNKFEELDRSQVLNHLKEVQNNHPDYNEKLMQKLNTCL